MLRGALSPNIRGIVISSVHMTIKLEKIWQGRDSFQGINVASGLKKNAIKVSLISYRYYATGVKRLLFYSKTKKNEFIPLLLAFQEMCVNV